MNKKLDLFLTFLKIGAFTFGGGYAMIPLIQREVCDNKKWLNEEDKLSVRELVITGYPMTISILLHQVYTFPTLPLVWLRRCCRRKE